MAQAYTGSGRWHPALRVLVACSKAKIPSDQVATREELDTQRVETEARLRSLSHSARDLYTGRAYRRSLSAVDRLAKRRPDLEIALHIASAGYGIVDSDEALVPYEAVMGTGPREWTERGRFLGMPGRAQALIESCDLAVFSLSRPYLTASSLRSIEPTAGCALVIGVEVRPASSRIHAVAAGRPQARAFDTAEREVGAVVLDRLLELIAVHGMAYAQALPPDPRAWPMP